ncbi:UNVERIFIED_CONTAM: Retrovirus-related Pol polyprotein from transposon [Sesamum latifolium]|uniref:Retrovirus-related Pol polyprotein from transposon n=1 Tax=Sesamum latifolium TaxID=2727402 RepID=A0AAW2Y915_9LAMI
MRFVLVFFTDILIYNTSWDSHLSHLAQELQVIVDNYFYVKLNKCYFKVPSVDYLGRVISTAVVFADQAKLQTIADWPSPHSFTNLRAFLGLKGYYHLFVYRYASIVRPLTDILKLQTFRLSWKAYTTFNTLKLAITSLPVLHLLDFSQSFDITTDASRWAIGVVLFQQCHPILFFSKMM